MGAGQKAGAGTGMGEEARARARARAKAKTCVFKSLSPARTSMGKTRNSFEMLSILFTTVRMRGLFLSMITYHGAHRSVLT